MVSVSVMIRVLVAVTSLEPSAVTDLTEGESVDVSEDVGVKAGFETVVVAENDSNSCDLVLRRRKDAVTESDNVAVIV